MISKISRAICIFLCFLTVFAYSCADNKTVDIVREYNTAESASEVCGLMPVTFVPDEFSVSAYRTVYDYVSETEYTAGEKTAVLRIVSTEYTVSNLSGFTDTGLEDVYTSKDDREFEIESREGVYACEWQSKFGETECNISFVLIGGELSEYRELLDMLLEYLDKGASDE